MDMKNKKNQALLRILSSEARQRLERIRMVNKDKAEYLEYLLIHLASQNILKRIPMEDETFKIFIENNTQLRKEITIRREYDKA
jgi:DNA-binding TFAR19-related protein (PDSD5 family)